MNTIHAALAAATTRLAPHSDARRDAELLLLFVIDAPHSRIYSAPEQLLSDDVATRYAALVAQRASGVPLAYLTGETEFWSLRLSVTPAVLIPRSETELLVERVLALAGPDSALCFVDAGTGSGAIAAALASEYPRARLLASDRSLAAARLAAHNFKALGLAHVDVMVSHWLDALATRSSDFVVSNPPYIGHHEQARLAAELAHEPAGALFADQAGLADLEKLISSAPRVLRPGGYLVLEHAYSQGPAVRELFARRAWRAIETVADLAGHERVTSAQCKT